jgi:hypothetical protein
VARVDIALALYWERKHPGESLVSFLNKTSSLGDTAKWASEQVAATVDTLLGGFGAVSIGYRLAASAGRTATRTTTIKKIRNEFPAFEHLIEERDPDRMIGYLPALFAYDLAQLQAEKPVFAIGILDTFEHVQSLLPERGGLEDLIARTVYLMPNVYFVITSRRPLQWHDSVRSVGLTYGGERRWPSLAGVTESSDQFPLDGFDDASAESYLKERLTRDQQPAIPKEIRHRIIGGAGGSPHYLELAAGLFEQIVARGEEPSPELFGRPFPELVLRVMRDMQREDRDLLRAAALLGAFDEEILHAVCPDVRGRQVRTFVQRRFVRQDQETWPPFRLHESLRAAVIECDENTPDGWTSSERRRFALCATSVLENIVLSIWNPARESTLSHGELSRRSVAAFLLTFAAAHDHHIMPPRLGQMAYTLRELGHWQVLASLPQSSNEAHADVTRLAAVARLSGRADTNARERYEDMVRAAGDFESGHYADYVGYELGNLAYSVGEIDRSDRYFDLAASAETVIKSGALYGRASNALRQSRFAEVVELIGQPHGSPVEQIRCTNMLGHVHLHNGQFSQAAEFFTSALERARRANAPLWAARASRHLALACMWLDPHRTLRVIPEARELNQSLGETVGLAQCDMAAAMAHALLGQRDEARTLLVDARRGFEQIGAEFELLPVDPVEILFDLAWGPQDAGTAATRALCEAARSGRPRGPRCWAAVSALWADLPQWYRFESCGWLDGPELARDRWLTPLHRLRNTPPSS